MSDANFDQEEPALAFTDEDYARTDEDYARTDEDYARRYFAGQSSAAVRSAKPATSPTSAKTAGGLHGGGNSFMRARRGRLAASSTA